MFTMKKSFLSSIAAFTFILIISSCTHKAAPVASVSMATDVKKEITGSAFAGEMTYKASCGRCHKLEDPASYTAKEWEPIMNSMAKKANLNDQQKADVTAYVVYNARK